MNEVVVCGAGGFIGGHLVADLLREAVLECGRSMGNLSTSGSRPLARQTTGCWA